MARKKRQDSIQESAVSAEGNQISYWVEIPVTQLVVGDQIVVATNPRTGKAVRSHEVKKLERYVRGCRNFHVNDTDCYDAAARVKVRI